MKAYDEGYSAGKQGKTWFDCPYSPSYHRFDYQSWMKGFADGQRDVKLPAYYDEY